MNKIVILIILTIVKLIRTTKITEINSDEVDDEVANMFNLNNKNFNKIFQHIEFITVSIENYLLFWKILQLISSNKSYFLINNNYCFNVIINAQTNSFLNSYYEIDEVFARKRRKRALSITSSGANKLNINYNNLIRLNSKNEGGFIFEINSFSIFEYIINCYLRPGGTYMFIINSKKSSNAFMNTSDDVYDEYFMDDVVENDINLDDISMLFNEIWLNYKIFKIFVYFNRQIITYNPFYYNFTLQRYGQLKICDNVICNGDFFKTINLKQLNGYPLKIEIFPSTYVLNVMDRKTRNKYYVGADMEVANTLRNVMNYSSIRVKHDAFNFGHRLPNGSFTGTLDRLIRRSSDVAINGFFIKDYLTRDIEFTTGVYSDHACLILPKANRIPSSLLPLLCFKAELWIMILLVLIGSSLFWCTLRWINSTTYFKRIYDSNCNWPNSQDRFNRSMTILKHKPFQYYQICVDTLMLMSSAPLRRFTKVTTERCFIITLCLISLVFVSIFQSKLATVFIEPLFFKDILTLKEMGKSNLKIVVKYPAMMDDVFPSNNSKLIEMLRQKVVLLDPKLPQITVDTAQKHNLAWVTRRSKAKLDNAIYITNQTVFMLPECPKTYNLAYVVGKNSVYLETINDILLHLRNGGVINKWINDMYYNQTLLDIRTYGSFYVAKFKTLTISDLQLAFMVLSWGILISIVLFVIELNIKKCSKLLKA